MGFITWTKSWSSADNGSVLGGTDLQNLQSDISSVINGNITNANIKSNAAIAESKIAFDTSSGHDHDGSNSKQIAAVYKHYRKGLTLYGDDDDNVCVYPGTVDIAGTVLTATSSSGDIAIATGSNWLHGASSTSQWIYVYVYNNSSSIGYKLSDEAPNVCDWNDNTAEPVFRYRAYTGTYYRCIGCVYQDADGDLCWGHSGSEGLYFSNFDATNVVIIGGKGTGADQTMNTLWTPKYVNIIYGHVDATPASTEALRDKKATKQMLDTNWYGTSLNINHTGSIHEWQSITDPASINAITPQAAGTSGSFTIDAMSDGYYWYAMAYTDLI